MSYLINQFSSLTHSTMYLSTNGVDFVEWGKNVQHFKTFDEALKWLPHFHGAGISSTNLPDPLSKAI